jgi:hypothetical protein
VLVNVPGLLVDLAVVVLAMPGVNAPVAVWPIRRLAHLVQRVADGGGKAAASSTCAIWLLSLVFPRLAE